MAHRVPFANPSRVIETLEKYGGAILTGFCDPSEVETVNQDVKPYLDAIKEERSSRNEPPGTARCTRLFGRSTTAREKWLQHPAFLQIVNHFLRTETIPYNDRHSVKMITDPILSASATLDIVPGVEAQDLHRDDFMWHQNHKASPDGYRMGSDVTLGLLVAGVKTTKENGGTMFVPSSHLWGHSRRPRGEEAVAAEMEVGEAFMFLGSTVHGGGSNVTHESRPMHSFFYCRSWMRPEENQHMWFTKEEVQTWSLAAQKQAGYVLGNPYLGHCNEANPVDLFRPGTGTTME